ncbi:MAG: TlpA family protein disulfide reductase [Burkholderiaceae bacterium]|nr:TlpA family protein disulfide reductase [Pseudomonadota bacterium]MBS0597294.1 TlpA family protein disulfide reductase [Pseudomonadota bacterium]MCO5116882.1 TlpA family protein disulfide reductase [Burkholderiaceae bacterium]MCP5218405.1 TlpA family protein disulfide reductase [Burkholderiaceae bacterium]
MPTRRLTLAGLLLAGALPGAQAQNVAKPWPASRALPPLAGTDLQGKAWDLAALRGRAVLVNFWATWCAPCKEEMPALQTLAELEGERLAVLAVNAREPLPRVRRYAQATGLTLPVLPDPQGAITRAWGVTVFPTTVLIDTRGRPQRTITGAVDWSDAPALGWVQALGG